MYADIKQGYQSDSFKKIWEKLTPNEQAKMTKLIARISEASYRRGAQHANVTLDHKNFPKDLADWRFFSTLDKCVGLTGFQTTAMQRLEIQHSGDLETLGIDLVVPDEPIQGYRTKVKSK